MFHWYFRSICNKISSNSDAVFVTEMLKTGLKSIHFKYHNYKGKVCITDPSCWLGGACVRGGWVPEQRDRDRWSSTQALLSSSLFTSLSSSHYQVHGGCQVCNCKFFLQLLLQTRVQWFWAPDKDQPRTAVSSQFDNPPYFYLLVNHYTRDV